MVAQVITAGNTTPPVGLCNFTFTADASELGLKPGEWPRTLQTSLGNKQLFVLDKVDKQGSHLYKQAGGCISLLVFND